MKIEKEKVLIAEIKQNRTAFGKIYNEYKNDIYRYSYALLGNATEAEDATSEAFYRALNKIEHFSPGEVSIKYWILAIARNVIYESYRKPNKLAFNADLDNFESEEGMVSSDPKLQSDIQKALSDLPELTREVILLKVWEEFKFNEIAELTQLTESAVKMQYYRGLDTLKESLKKNKYDQSYALVPFLTAPLSSLQMLDAYKLPERNADQILSSLLEGSKSNIKLSQNSFMKSLSKPLQYALYSTAALLVVAAPSVILYNSYVKDEPVNENNQEISKDENETNTDKPTEQDPDSEDGTDTTPDANEKDFVSQTFIVEYWLNDGGMYKLRAEMPEDVTIETGGLSTAPSTTITLSDGSYLQFSIPHMGFYKQFKTVGPEIPNPNIEGIYRVINQYDNVEYVNELSLAEKCILPPIQELEPPCGAGSIHIEPEASVSVLYFGATASQPVADSIMSTLELVAD